MSTSRTNQVEPTQPGVRVLVSPDKVTRDDGSQKEVKGLTSPEKAAPEEGSQLEVKVPNNKEEAKTEQGSQEVDKPDEATTDSPPGQPIEVRKSFVVCLHIIPSSILYWML